MILFNRSAHSAGPGAKNCQISSLNRLKSSMFVLNRFKIVLNPVKIIKIHLKASTRRPPISVVSDHLISV
jgi:hypothetical protein